ncbi:hypothetical protein Q1695_009438 [Nippostrongylus brasiliensis]|nr:hypothetical protein Q1695_009438 [Nippostrongylus brasiliensis]
MRLVTVLLMAEVTMQNRAPVRQQWEVDPVHFVPPLEWETYDIPQSRRQYMEHEWSLASYANDCGEEGSVNIVPVYFWPGDQVDLPCLMCELGFVFNGKMKIWGKSTDILKFLENPKVIQYLFLVNMRIGCTLRSFIVVLCATHGSPINCGHEFKMVLMRITLGKFNL